MFEESLFINPPSRYGVLQITHDFQFAALNLKDDFQWPTDSSEAFRLDYIAGRLDRLKRRGFAGVVINVAFEKYMEDEKAWLRFHKTVEMAKEKGFRIWLYDEQYYPSGFAGGLTLHGHPELEAQGLVCVTREVSSPDAPVRIASPLGHSSLRYAYAVPLREGCPDYDGQLSVSEYMDAGGGFCWNCPGGDWRIYVFFTRALYEGTYLPHAMRAPQRNINVCDDRAVKRFLDVTYEKYEQWLGRDLMEAIETVFTDEPALFAHREYPSGYDPDERYRKEYASFSVYERPNTDIPLYPFIHWTYNLEEKFRKLRGYSLTDKLPRLFDGETGSEGLRLDLFLTLGDLFDEAWNRQYSSLLQGLGIHYSGHMLYEENLYKHPYLYGDVLKNLGAMTIPGCDLLSSDPEVIRHAVACKMASSAAHLYGREHVMIEASNMFDRDQSLSLDALCLAMAVEFALGVDTITSYYGENFLTDEEYRHFNTFVARLGRLFDGGIHQAQAIIYYPFKQAAALTAVQKHAKADGKALELSKSMDSLSVRLLERQLDFDFINDEFLLKGIPENGCFRMSGGKTPSLIVLPEISFVPDDTGKKLREAMDAGVIVLADGPKRCITGLENCPALKFIGDGLPESGDFKAQTYCPELLVMHKKFKGQELYLLVNTGKSPVDTEASLPGAYRELLELSIKTGEMRSLDTVSYATRLQFRLKLQPEQSIVLVNRN